MLLATVFPSGLTAQPVVIDGEVPAEGGFRRVKLLKGLVHPWAMAWLPNGDRLVTERRGGCVIEMRREKRVQILDSQFVHLGNIPFPVIDGLALPEHVVGFLKGQGPIVLKRNKQTVRVASVDMQTTGFGYTSNHDRIPVLGKDPGQSVVIYRDIADNCIRAKAKSHNLRNMAFRRHSSVYVPLYVSADGRFNEMADTFFTDTSIMLSIKQTNALAPPSTINFFHWTGYFPASG